MPRKASPKCLRCAALHIDQMHQIHGSPKTDPQNFVRDSNIPSDGCYNPKVCPPKRSRLRNAEINRQKHFIERQEQLLEHFNIDSPYTDLTSAILIVYREARYDSPVHAIAGAVWKGTRVVGK